MKEQLAYTEGDAATACGVPRATIREGRRSGKLRAVKSGRRWVILREDLLAWLQHCRERGEIPTPVSAADRERFAALNLARRRQAA
jgi:excisionase family DNA binding protein